MLLSGAAYLGVLYWAYVQVLYPSYTDRLYLIDLSPLQIALNVGMAIVPLLVLPTRLERPSSVALYGIYAMLVAPTCLFATYFQVYWTADPLAWQVATVLCFLGLVWFCRLPLPDIRQIKIKPVVYWVGIVAFALLTLIYIELDYGLKFSALNLLDVYDVRDEFGERASRFVGYGVAWLANVIGPLMVAAGLAHRRWLLAAAAVPVQLMTFLITGSKSYLFGLVYIAAILVALGREGKNLGRNFMLLATGGIVLAGIIDMSLNLPLVSALTTLRGIITPAQVSTYWYDFFSQNPPLMLADGVLQGIVPNPYDVQAVYLIGGQYFGDSNMASNAGLWGDGFGNFGMMGMAAATAIAGFYFWIYDAASKGKNKVVAALVLALPVTAVTNANILTCFLTHGLLLALIVIYLMPPNKPSTPPSRPSEAL